LHSTLAKFDGVGVNTFLGVLHEFAKQDKGKEFTLRVLRSFPPIDTKDVEVNPLHVIFD
jgi:hypothetical protein